MRQVCFLLLLAGLFVSAQTASTPNLSGSWKMNAAKSKLPKQSKIQSEVLVIKQNGADVEFHFEVDGQKSVQTYKADKTERVIREVRGGNIVVKAYWKGTTLIAETRAVLKLPNSPFNNSEIIHTKSSWTLSDDGLVLTETSESENSRAVTVYDKQ